MPSVHVFADLNELSRRAAEAVAGTIKDTVRAAGRCSVVLSGGHAPRPLYGLLASDVHKDLPWGGVHLFWGDERYVPPDDARSNYGMARATLLDHVPCPSGNIHPMPTHFAEPADAARDYERTLTHYFGGDGPRFDVALLGLGADGHTASLFPGSAALRETTRWVLAVTAPAEPPLRLTLTLPVLKRSASTHFLVTGSDKAHAVGRVLSGGADPNMYPAAAIHLADSEVVWWLDSPAASQRQ